MDHRAAFRVGDWVQVGPEQREAGRLGRVAQRNDAVDYCAVEFCQDGYLNGVAWIDWQIYGSADLNPTTPTEEELATWLITRLTN